MEEKAEGMLSPYRVLDLTDEKGLLCGKLLGDLGADVIKVEKPGGDPARNIGPFYHDEVDPEKSLFWWAFNTSKRGITLDIETAEGQEAFRKLVQGADFVIESFPPGYLDGLGLGYSALEEVNPGIILVSITPFGQTGPYKDYKGPDIVVWAMGGQMYPCGDADRPPVRISHHSQAHLHGGAEAAAGALMALHHRQQTGEGQHVDVSIQESLAQATYLPTLGWDMMRVVHRRGEGLSPGIRMTRMWRCKDGHVFWIYWGGALGHSSRPLVKWMEAEGMADDFLKRIDWETFDTRTTTQEVVDAIEEPTGKFFISHTKDELLAGALKHGAMLYPVSTTTDIVSSVQLSAREFWVDIWHPELGAKVMYPGGFAKTSEAPPAVSRRAPLIGEHNQEVYERELDIRSERQSASTRPRLYQTKLDSKDDGKSKSRKPLDGIKVLDFGWAVAGPTTTKPLSICGAEVVKIESESRPDPVRVGGPFKEGIPGLNRSGQLNQYNTGKLSIALNLAHPKGVEIAKGLVSWADVVVENFAGGAMKRMGLDYEELKKVKPDIIMLSSCMQGQTGPYATHPGYGWHLTALSGYFSITGWPDRGPTAPDGPYTDYIAPRLSVLAILAALDYRRRKGKGQYIDISQYETGVHFIAPLILDYVANHRVATRMGNRHPCAAPHGAYRCLGEDRWCAIAIFTDEEWKSFAGVIGNPAWTNNPKFASLQTRKENEDELDKLVEDWTINHSAEEVTTLMQDSGVAAGVLATGEDMMEYDPQLNHRHLFWELDHPEVGKHRVTRPSFVLSKCPYEVQRAPLLGEHNERVLKDILNMPDEEIAELVMEGVIE